jgi:phosphatidylethanolamine N-methyltransferase
LGRRVANVTVFRFGIEFAPEVVQADGNARNLAWRICNAKKILVSTGRAYERVRD